jgi:hypothetical protein
MISRRHLSVLDRTGDQKADRALDNALSQNSGNALAKTVRDSFRFAAVIPVHGNIYQAGHIANKN